jgi:hypothetical protein
MVEPGERKPGREAPDSRRLLRRTLVITAILFALTVGAVALVAWSVGEPEDAPFEYELGRSEEVSREPAQLASWMANSRSARASVKVNST